MLESCYDLHRNDEWIDNTLLAFLLADMLRLRDSLKLLISSFQGHALS